MAKRNAAGAGSLRKRSNGTWEARYTAGYNPATGKQIQRSIYGKTQKEVRQKLAQVITELDNGIYIAPQKMTVGEWLNLWLTEYTNGVKQNTLHNYRNQVNTHIIPALGSVKLLALNTPTIQHFYNALQEGTAPSGRLSASSIKGTHSVLRQALQQAVKIGYLRSNPALYCALPRAEKREVKPLDDDQIKIFLTAIQGHKLETLFLFDLFTGLREGEILGLQWDCVDFDKGVILVNKQLIHDREKRCYALGPLKNDKPRTIVPAEWIMQTLKSQKARQAEQQLRAGSLWKNEWNLVFTNELGGYIPHETAYKNFKRLVKEIGVP